MKEEKQLNMFNSHCFSLPFTNPLEGPDPPKKWFTSKKGTLCPVLPIFSQMWEGDALVQPSESACFRDINKVTSEKKCHNFHTIWKAYKKKTFLSLWNVDLSLAKLNLSPSSHQKSLRTRATQGSMIQKCHKIQVLPKNVLQSCLSGLNTLKLG